MRRRTAVATATLIVVLALAGLPASVGSRTPSAARELAPAAFTSVIVTADLPALSASGGSGAALDSVPEADVLVPYVEPGAAPKAPVARPRVAQPASSSGEAWKAPKRTLTGFASFYDNGTTAMRLPRGTVIRICGKGGCIERVVNDYGPVAGTSRIIDMYRPDFFRICGCGSWSGTTRVTVSIY